MDTFNTSGDPAQPQQPATETNTLSFNVGDRSYDAESAAKKIQSADQHIETILAEKREMEAKLAEMQAQLEQSTKLDDALKNMRTDYPTNESVSQPQPQLDLDSLKGQILSEVTKTQEEAKQKELREQQEATAKANFQQVAEQMAAMYGETNIDKVIEEKAQANGMTFKDACELAKTHPKMFLNSFGNGRQAPQTPNISGNNSRAHNAHQTTDVNLQARRELMKELINSGSVKKETLYGLVENIKSNQSMDDLRNKWSYN